MASFTGKLVSSFPGVEFGPLHYRSLIADKDNYLRLSSGDFDVRMTLSQAIISEVQWWLANIQSAVNHIAHPSPASVLYTDASKLGWGARLSVGGETAGIWSQSESVLHIIGGTKSLECNSLAQQIWAWAVERNIWLSAAHLPGVDNVAADRLSRELNLDLEWMLAKPVFYKIAGVFGQPKIDLFASRLNFQTTAYVSWKPDPQATYVDAFSIVWSDIFFYAFPPFCLLSRCVQKIIQEQACQILVLPLWTTKPVFSQVLHLLADIPRVVKGTRHTLIHPTLTTAHPLHNRLDLLVCKLSGNVSTVRAFQKTLSACSCRPGGNLPIHSTVPTSTSGFGFVVNKKLIPLSETAHGLIT